MGVSIGSPSQSQLGLKGGTSCFAHLPSLLFHSNRVVAERVYAGRVPKLKNFISLGLPNSSTQDSSQTGLRHCFLLAVKKEQQSPS